MERWRRNLSDATWQFALPLLVALLPWRLGFALLTRIARAGWGFGAAVDAAWQAARTRCVGIDEARFRFEFRLLLLVDRCDSWLVLLRSSRWWQHRVDLRGEGAALHAGLFLNVHWGAGNFIWRMLSGAGIRAYFIVRRADVHDVGHGRISRWFLAWRGWMIRRVGCAGAIYTGGSRARVQGILQSGGSVLGMLDLPAAPAQRALEVVVLGAKLRFPIGLAELAREAGVPITLIACGLNPCSGRRVLDIETLPVGLATADVMARYGAWLDRHLRAQPALWPMWPHAAAFFSAPAEAPDADAPQT